MSGLGGRARQGILWSTVAYVATKASTFLSTIVLARLLTPNEFGVVAAIVVFIALLELASDLGMKAVVVYEQEEGVTDRVQTAFTANLLLSALLCAIAVLLAPLAARFFDLEEQTGLFRLASLSLLLTGLGNVQDALLLRDLDFKRRLRPDLARVLVRAAVSIGLALAGSGAASLVVGLLAGQAVWVLVQWRLTRLRPTFALHRSVLRSMAAYGGAAALLEVVAVIGTRTDVAVIGRVLGDRMLGLYTVAFRVPELLIESVAWNVSTVAFPALSRQRAADEQGLATTTLSLLRLQALYALPVASGLAVLSGPVIVTLFGDQWRPAAGVLTAVAFMSAISAVAFPVGDVFKAVGRQRTLVAVNCVTVPLQMGTIVAVASAGLTAVAWVRTADALLYATLVVGQAARIVGLPFRDVLVALRPAAVTALGVAAGAGTVRLALDGDGPVVLIAGAAAAALGGLAALRAGAPVALGEVWALLQRTRAAQA